MRLKNEPEQPAFDVIKKAAWEGVTGKIGVTKAMDFNPSPGQQHFQPALCIFFLWYGFLSSDVPRNLCCVGQPTANLLETEITWWPLQWPTASSFPVSLRVESQGQQGPEQTCFFLSSTR